jgi:hypothetical protein
VVICIGFGFVHWLWLDWRSASVGNLACMESAAAIVLVLLVLLPVVLVGALFV